MTRIYPTPVTAETATLPPIRIVLDSIYDSPHHTLSTKCSFFYASNKRWVQGVLLCLLIILIALIIIVSKGKSATDNPCISYTPDTLAHKVSLSCFRYLWSRACPAITLPSDYDGGWWLRSPNGLQMIPCYPLRIVEHCGAGSYGSIAIYISLCRLDYNGI